ncbi:hypothetical protein ACUXST_000053 [Sphingomonas sp. F9_3S_D5_B_2]
MRICLYVGKAAPPEAQEEWLANAKSTCDVYASNLYREFTKRGHEVVFASSLSARPSNCSDEETAKRVARYEKMTFPEADHAICLEQNGWRYRDRIFFEKARAVTKGLICSICDHDAVVDGPQDFVFTARRPLHPSRARYVGWAADADMFRPQKDPEWLTIFVDHKYHSVPKADETEALLKSATAYAARLAAEERRVGDPPRRVQVVFFSPNGLERIEPGEVRDVDLGTDRRSFYKRVPGPELAQWTRKTDIFVVTHGESMGLPILENALAGALILNREGFVKPDLLRSLAHQEYTAIEQINWDALVARLNPERFRRRASHFTWSRVAERMLDTFAGRSEEVKPEPRQQGTLLIAPPAKVSAPRFSELATWQCKNVAVTPRAEAEALVPLQGQNHFLRSELNKNPWPETFTLTFNVRPNGRDNLGVWLCGEFEEERAEARFDLQSLDVSTGRIANGWGLLQANAIRRGDEVVCQMVVHSDWAPVLRCYMLLARGESLDFEPDANEPGLEIRRIMVEKGLGLMIDVGEPETSQTELRTAAAH